MQLRCKNPATTWIIRRALCVGVLCGLGATYARAQAAFDVFEEQSESGSRIRVGATYYRFALGDKKFSAIGPEFGFERSLATHWNASAAVGQAFALSSQLTTLLTSIDFSLWYSVTGKFTQQQRTWKHNGNMIVEYSDDRTGGLRLGIGTQQYFFNVSKGAIPFSGLSAKALYEFGINSMPFDLALGAEAARLANGSDKATSIRAYLALILPLRG